MIHCLALKSWLLQDHNVHLWYHWLSFSCRIFLRRSPVSTVECYDNEYVNDPFASLLFVGGWRYSLDGEESYKYNDLTFQLSYLPIICHCSFALHPGRSTMTRGVERQSATCRKRVETIDQLRILLSLTLHLSCFTVLCYPSHDHGTIGED